MITPERIEELRKGVGCLIPRPSVEMPSCHEFKHCDCITIELLDEISRLREALKFYAHAGPMSLATDADYGSEMGFSVIKPGKRARAALEDGE